MVTRLSAKQLSGLEQKAFCRLCIQLLVGRDKSNDITRSHSRFLMVCSLLQLLKRFPGMMVSFDFKNVLNRFPIESKVGDTFDVF